jgi:hypothetical protein
MVAMQVLVVMEGPLAPVVRAVHKEQRQQQATAACCMLEVSRATTLPQESFLTLGLLVR